MDEKLGRPAGTSAQLITFIKDRPGHDMRYAIDCTKLQNELGWAPSLKFEEGLALTIDWYLANTEWVDNILTGAYRDYYQAQYVERVK
jgi:dTDP-glucose 4,6-dehydratase